MLPFFPLRFGSAPRGKRTSATVERQLNLKNGEATNRAYKVLLLKPDTSSDNKTKIPASRPKKKECV